MDNLITILDFMKHCMNKNKSLAIASDNCIV